MGRRKSKKRKQAKKRAFKSNQCIKCALCNDGFSPDFCYDVLFSKSPKRFVSHVFTNLISHRHFVLQILEKSYEEVELCGLSLSIFRQIFCTSCICDCGVPIERLQYCISAFKKQADGFIGPKTVRKVFSNKYKKRKKKKADPIPKVSVIISNNDAFKAEVRQILENNLKQPNKDREST